MKKSYEAPRLTVHGAVESLTQQTTVGTILDRTLPEGSPASLILQSLTDPS